MKRFLSTIAFCVFLFICGLLFLLPSTQAEKNLLQSLLNLPAPPSPDSLILLNGKVFSPDFFSKNKPPADDAPLEELLAYWRSQSENYRELAYNIKPSERSLQRIVSEIEGNPEKLTEFLNILPDKSDTADFVKRIYDSRISREDVDEDWNRSVKKWLTYHSKYFSDELLAVAAKVGDTDEYVTNQDELLALARVDWDKARPILERLYKDHKQPVSQTLARWAFYRHALDEDSASDIEKYRDELKAVVENKSATAGMRDLAIDALVKEKEWDGLDDWYSTMVEDETLADLRVNGRSYTGLTTIMYYSPPEKRLEKMLQLIKSVNPTVRNAAVRNLAFLLNDKNPEVARALLPWLENADWAKEVGGERRRLISALGSLEMPESVPGLIAVLNEKQSRQRMGNMMSNSMGSITEQMTNSNRAVVSNNASAEDYFPLRSEAIGALAKQKDARAVAPLRAILPEVEGWQITNVVRALLGCGGFSIPEQIEALEFIAKNNKREDEEIVSGSNMAIVSRDAPMPPGKPMPLGFTMMGGEDVRLLFNPSNIKPILGIQITNQTEADENLVAALILRIEILDEKDPLLAFGLRKIMQNWQGAAINALMLRDLKNNKSDTDAVVKLLSLRKELRDKQWTEVSDIRGGSPTALGIAACLTENANEYDALLQSENIEAKTAMLACARLIRAALPVRKVAENLKSPNKLLALAAERYLETEDSPEAQAFVLSIHPNEAKILGARKLFIPDDVPITNSVFLPALFSTLNETNFIQNYYYLFIGSNGELAANEKTLQREIKATQELLGVYAYDDNYIRIYKDRAVFSWQTDKARYHERPLSKEEFDGFKDYLAAERINEMPQFVSQCREDCQEKELLMLGRNGGRRIFLLASEPPRFFVELEKILTNLRQSPAKLRYALEKDVAGLEILYADENLPAEAVWKNGADFRVLLSDAMQRERIDDELEKLDAADAAKAESSEEGAGDENIWVKQQKRRAQREFENFAWYKYADQKLAGTTDQPKQAEYIPIPGGAGVRAIPGQWKARTATFEMRSDAEGLYKIAGGGTVKIRDGYYDDSIVITPNGRWAIAKKYVEDEGAAVFRVNLTTKKEFPVKSEEYPQFEPVGYVPAINKVLIFGGFGHEETGDTTQRRGEYFFLDAETGAINKAKGEVRPLAQQTFRPLQSNGKSDEFWAAIPDAGKNETSVGVYNAKTLVFKSILKLPQIQFNSMQMWIDADVVYFVYEGHLLSLPLQPKTNAPVTN